MAGSEIKVLYVAGFSRCGSTLLGSLLGQLEGFFNLGEARMMWQRSILDDRHCGCGVSFSECPVWSGIMERFEVTHPGVSVPDMAQAVASLTRTRELPLSSRFESARSAVMDDAAEIQDVVGALYEAVATETGSRVLVDTSKVPMYAYMLRHAGLDVRVVHLLRDPRAVARSRLVPKQHVDSQGTMGGVSILNTAVSWNLVNGSIERLLSDTAYRRLGYEKMIEDPGGTLKELASFMDETANTEGWLSGRIASLQPTHSLYGNPGRFSAGTVELAIDDRWRSLPAWKSLLVNSLTMRTRHRFRDAL